MLARYLHVFDGLSLGLHFHRGNVFALQNLRSVQGGVYGGVSVEELEVAHGGSDRVEDGELSHRVLLFHALFLGAVGNGSNFEGSLVEHSNARVLFFPELRLLVDVSEIVLLDFIRGSRVQELRGTLLSVEHFRVVVEGYFFLGVLEAVDDWLHFRDVLVQLGDLQRLV